jgi:hypothetical protein
MAQSAEDLRRALSPTATRQQWLLEEQGEWSLGRGVSFTYKADSYSVTRKLVPWPQCQFTNNESKVFEEKELRFIICQTRRRTERVNFSKLYHPTSERKTCAF